nr:methyltransferase-helicase [Martellivirales sp.]
MDQPQRSTAGPREFDSTAIAKLRSRGVPKHIAESFVKIGLPKSGRVEAIRDTVCKMQYKKYFLEKSGADFDDPFRVGFYEPVVIPNNEARFHCEFEMNDIESTKFSMLFPEFSVVAKGKTFNQHAFYANKRYAEAELLVGMVHRDAKRTGLDGRSLIDLGGNDTWHTKRGRDYVHCDNPLMSVRDKMRYDTREIFSGSLRATVCSDKFHDCKQRADYAMAVHSTYDLTPKAVAAGMYKRGIRRFFGVINYIPGIENKPAGLYESDGLEMEVCRPSRGPPYVRCGFLHDPSLRYEHKLSTIQKYLMCQQQFDFFESDGTRHTYTYSIHSVRGNSIVFVIDDVPRGVALNNTMWAPGGTRHYKISLDFLGVKEQEVNREFFDRLVLQACSARNMSNYDIVSLFRYAKSLRQRISLNGIVLSSGYTHRPDELVNVVIAAYATACAYRSESGSFFKEASSQISSARYRGFITDTISIVGVTLKTAALLLPFCLYKVSRLNVLSDKIKALVNSNTAVRVELVKPHANKGQEFDPFMFKRRVVLNNALTSISNGATMSPYSRYYGASLLPVGVKCDEGRYVFFSRGLINYDLSERPKYTSILNVITLPEFKGSGDRWVDNARNHYYGHLFDSVRMFKDADRQHLLLPNGDVMYRHAISGVMGDREVPDRADSFVSNEAPFTIFRGVGRYAVKLNPPKCYDGGRCVGFYMCFESRVLASRLVGRALIMAGDVDLDDVESSGESSRPPPYDDLSSHGWTDLNVDSPSSVDIRTFGTAEEGRDFVERSAEQGQYYMSGGLDQHPPITPPVEHQDFIRDAAFSAIGVVTDVADSSGSGDGESTVAGDPERVPETVSSSDVTPGREAMLEFVEVCDRSRGVAVASAKMVMDMAVSASKGDPVKQSFKVAAAQHPGNVTMVKVVNTDDGARLYDYFNPSDELEHMAVSDGHRVFDRTTESIPDGIYVTSDVMRIFTGNSLRDAVASVVNERFECMVTCVDGIAGSGKSYTIVHTAKPGDVVLCETSAALSDIARDLFRVPGWKGHAYTVDSFLMHQPVSECDVLWIDEAFRLHAGKVYALMKLLKPSEVRCFGDSKQIPPLSFVPGMDLVHHEYPYTNIVVKKDSWRFGADVCLALSQRKYYGYHAVTHCSPLRSFKGPKSFVQGCFHDRSSGVALLTYTKTARDDLKKQGVKGVMTIGESQGKTFDHVYLFRDSSLNKALYHDLFQTLVAATRHRHTFTYFTVCALEADDSAVAELYRYNTAKSNEVVLSSHLCPGVRPVADYTALLDRAGGSPATSSDQEASPPPEVMSVGSDWGLFEEDDDSIDFSSYSFNS